MPALSLAKARQAVNKDGEGAGGGDSDGGVGPGRPVYSEGVHQPTFSPGVHQLRPLPGGEYCLLSLKDTLPSYTCPPHTLPSHFSMHVNTF